MPSDLSGFNVDKLICSLFQSIRDSFLRAPPALSHSALAARLRRKIKSMQQNVEEETHGHFDPSKWSGKYAMKRNESGNKRNKSQINLKQRAQRASGSVLRGSDEHTYCSQEERPAKLRCCSSFLVAVVQTQAERFSARGGRVVNKTPAVVIDLHLFCFCLRKCNAIN